MASYKKHGQANFVKRGQLWKNIQNGRVGRIVGKNSHGTGKVWNMEIGRKCHHINEGTVLKYFQLLG